MSCICSDGSFFSRFLISLIFLLSSTTPACSSTSSNSVPLLTTSSRDTVGLVKQNLRNFWEWVSNINCVFVCLPSFSKLHLLAIDLRRLQNCCTVSSLSWIVFWNLCVSKVSLVFGFLVHNLLKNVTTLQLSSYLQLYSSQPERFRILSNTFSI